MRRLEGAYSVTALAEGKLLAFRDPHGFRPLVLGRLADGWVVASETCALDLVGAELERELAPRRAARRRRGRRAGRARRCRPRSGALCIFEFFYLARPDSRLEGVEVHAARVRMGERLAEEAPVEADLVLPIPDSGTPAAIGFSRATGIPFSEGLIKNRYVGRTFIQPDQELRQQGIRLKFNPLAEVAGQARRDRRRLDRPRQHDAADRLDALRRRRDRGARADLVAAGRRAVLLRHRPRRRGRADRRRRASVEEVRASIGATSLAYLSLDGPAGATTPARVGALPRLPDRRVPDADPRRPPAGEAPVRAGARLIPSALPLGSERMTIRHASRA